jgi:hypothetical protein
MLVRGNDVRKMLRGERLRVGMPNNVRSCLESPLGHCLGHTGHQESMVRTGLRATATQQVCDILHGKGRASFTASAVAGASDTAPGSVRYGDTIVEATVCGLS